jgi:hypothetical protein
MPKANVKTNNEKESTVVTFSSTTNSVLAEPHAAAATIVSEGKEP